MLIGIVGAGASGVLCAIFAASRGHDVVIFERKDRILKKVLVTGNGTCNYTNINANYLNYFSIEDKIDEYIFENYGPNDVIEFFKTIGIEPSVEERGKVYPISFQASSLVDALRFKLESFKNIDIKLDFDVKKIRKKNGKFNITSQNVETISVDKLVLASGGNSYQELGSNGSGYELASKMGHSISKIYPILVQLKSDKKYIKGLEGVKMKVVLSVYNKKEFLRSDSNELLFTPYGISGPTVFNLSYLTALYNMEDLNFYVDFMPKYDEKTLKEMLIYRKNNMKYMSAEYFLNGLVNKKLGQFLLKYVGLEKLNMSIDKIDDKIIDKLVTILKNYHIKVFDTTGYSNAQVTAGGILVKEINNKTFESKMVKDMYIIGEVLDVFGDCGGYNLTWCFITGMHVGKNI